jgi:hypothetical protein
MEPDFIVLDEIIIPVNEIKYARYQIEPGTAGTPNMDEVLCVFWKHGGGHITVPGKSITDLSHALSRAGQYK